MQSIDNNIVTILKSKGLTKRALAAHLGISETAINRTIRNNRITMDTLSKIGKFLDCPVTDLLNDTNTSLSALEPPTLDNIRDLRTKVGVSQEKFAEMLGVHSRTVQNWERGGVIPDSKYAILRKIETEDICSPEMLKDALRIPSIDTLMDLIQSQQRAIENLSETVRNLSKPK